MSTQNEAKAVQGYVPKLVPNTCSKCKYFALDLEKIYYGMAGNFFYREKNLRCTVGDFSVKKTATCKQFEAKK